MKRSLVSSVLCSLVFIAVAVYAQPPSYQRINRVDVHTAEIDIKQTNILEHLNHKIQRIFQDIDTVCTHNPNPAVATEILEQTYLRNDGCFANYTGSNTFAGLVSERDLYPLESCPDYFMNYSVQLLPANYDSYTATFSPQQTILKLVFSVYAGDQIETINTPPAYSIVKTSQLSTPILTKTVYVGLPNPILNRKDLLKIEIQNKLRAEQRTQRKASSARIAVIGVLLALFVLFFIALVLVGITVAVSAVKKEKREHIRISCEVQKIDAMVDGGRITPDEARELKHAFGPAACTEISHEPDSHVKIVGTVHIVASAFKLLMLVVVFFGLALFSGVAHFSNRPGHIVLLPVLLIIIFALVFLALTVFHIIAAVKLMKGAPWARIVSLYSQSSAF